jgi:hypothetical protein
VTTAKEWRTLSVGGGAGGGGGAGPTGLMSSSPAFLLPMGGPWSRLPIASVSLWRCLSYLSFRSSISICSRRSLCARGGGEEGQEEEGAGERGADHVMGQEALAHRLSRSILSAVSLSSCCSLLFLSRSSISLRYLPRGEG